MPEFSFRKVPDVQPTALPNPFLVLSCEFCVCEQFQSSYFPEHLWKTASDIGFPFFKKEKYVQAQFMKQYIKYLIQVHRTSEF